MIENDTSTRDNPYSIYKQGSSSDYYWIASPHDGQASSTLVFVGRTGYVGGNWQSTSDNRYNRPNSAFRPLVLLDSNYTLEKTKDTNGNDAFKIVEK